MRYASYQPRHLQRLGIDRVLVEVEHDRVLREVGLDATREVAHRKPDRRFRFGWGGLIDYPIDPRADRWRLLGRRAAHLSEAEFELAWRRPVTAIRPELQAGDALRYVAHDVQIGGDPVGQVWLEHDAEGTLRQIDLDEAGLVTRVAPSGWDRTEVTVGSIAVGGRPVSPDTFETRWAEGGGPEG